MAACPALSPLSYSRRPRLTLTPQRLEANRRNAARSTGPRTAQGKARIARNAIKHGFFTAQSRWTPQQHRDFEAMLAGLREDFRPDGPIAESCVHMMAEAWVRMASALRYEGIAALRHHQQLDRALDERIASAGPVKGAELKALREDARAAGLWRPTLPAQREAIAITRYLGRLAAHDWSSADAVGEAQGRRARPTPEIAKTNPLLGKDQQWPLFRIAGQESRDTPRESRAASHPEF